MTLDGTFGDVDGDLDETVWWIDGVRVDDAVTSVSVTEPHTVQAVARDARGATTTAEANVGCM